MSQKAKIDARYVTKGKAAGIAIACLVIGFVGGVVYSTLTPGPGGAGNQGAAGPFAAPMPAASAEMSARIFALEQKVSGAANDLSSWLELGNLYFDKGDHNGAIRAYGKYLALNPSNPDVWTDLGVMYRQAGQPAEAVKCFDRALAVSPDHPQSRYNKGVVLLHDLNQADQAIAEWKILAEKHPDFKTQEGRSIQEILRNMK